MARWTFVRSARSTTPAIATPFAERLLTGFGQTPEAIEVGIGDPECDGSSPERRALAHQRPHYPPYQRVYIC